MLGFLLTSRLTLAVLLTATATFLAPGSSVTTAQTDAPSRLEATLFGSPALIDVRPLADPVASRDALADVLELARELERLVDVGDVLAGTAAFEDGVRAVNAAAGRGTVAVDRRVLDLLHRALEYCRWSQGAYGPLGGMLNGLWGLRRSVGGLPPPGALDEQAELASCDRLELDLEAGTARLAAGSRLDLWGFERGFVVDRVVEALLARGFVDGWVQVGHVTRAFGPGPGDRGWPMEVEPLENAEALAERIFLRDRALAMASRRERVLDIAGERFAPYLDHRTGRPAGGKAAVLVVAEGALDAEALAATLFVLSNREGEFRLGSLRPQPAVKWLLGEDEGAPLIMLRGWAQLDHWTPP